MPAEYHVSVNGDDSNDGSAAAMLKTISAAALKARPGDVVTVHAGTYRERVNPPRGGESDTKRIVYRAAPGGKVVITGAEVVKGWENVEADTWKVTIPNTFFGGFNPYADLIRGDWFDPQGRQHHTGCVYLNGDWLTEAAKLDEVLKPADKHPLWFGEVDGAGTTIRAQFPGVNPNDQLVEINVRQTVFYPDKPGRNFITVRGFTMCQAATPWAPPTAEQVGLIGTHWSKGWIIENNTISHSICSGISLGKHGDEFDNTSADTAEGYVKTIERALVHPIAWSKANIGGHVVRDNTIAHCGQAGIVGSMGCAFSTVTGNDIHDIHRDRFFGGAEMAGIKFHGALDVVIADNHIHRCGGLGAIWLDWMAQGTRVEGNLLHDNTSWAGDLFCEVNHGPYLIANNIFLSDKSHLSNSRGGAYAHNLIAGSLQVVADQRRTPYFKAHDTDMAGLHDCPVGDVRLYNNLLGAHANFSAFDGATLPVAAAGNVFTRGAQASRFDTGALIQPDFDPGLKLIEKADGWYLEFNADTGWRSEQKRMLVSTELLGRAKIPDLPFENPDGTALRLDRDYFGRKRNPDNPFPGPFETVKDGNQEIKVWPK